MSSSFVDTSYLVRYLTGEPPEMAALAQEAIESDETLILSPLAVVETAYVLESFYQMPRDPIVDAVSALINRKNIHLLDLEKSLLLRALQLCRGSKRTSFTDAVLWSQARHKGAPGIYTFDRRFPSEHLQLRGSAP